MPKITVELKPFPIPDLVAEVQKPVRRQDGMQVPRTHKLSDIPKDVLEEMIEEFKIGVLSAAGYKGTD